MKKLLLLALTLMLSFTLFACDPEEGPNDQPDDPITCDEDQELIDGECVDKIPELTDADRVEEAKDALDLGDLSAITDDIELPTEGLHGTQITWSSSNEFWVTVDGIVTRPYLGISTYATVNVCGLDYGVCVDVQPLGAAEDAGLQNGDVIVGYKTQDMSEFLDIYNFNDLREAILNSAVGDEVVLRYYRDGTIYESDPAVLNVHPDDR